MKSRGHVYMADLLYQELCQNEGKLELRTLPDEEGKFESTWYHVPEQIYLAIRANRGCFLAGAIGPDFFPDLITGQSRIHPKDSGKWLDMMYEELRKIPPYSQEFQKALAFYMGWMMHYCGDMYGHHFVNLYAYGWFPSIYEMYEDFNHLVISPVVEKVFGFVKRFLTEEEIQELIDDPSIEGFIDRLLTDPEAVDELTNEIKEFENAQDPWEKIVEVLVDVFRLLRLVNSAANIIRHISLEAYMDHTILWNQKNVVKKAALEILQGKMDENSSGRNDPWTEKLRNVQREVLEQIANADPADLDIDMSIFYDLEIPHDFIRRCFTTPEAFHRMQALCGEDPSQPLSALDILGKYVEYYEEEYQAMLSGQDNSSAMENLELRARYLDKWVSFWMRFVENDIKYGKPIPEGHRLRMAEEIAELYSAFDNSDEDKIRGTESICAMVNAIMGVLKPAEPILEAIGVTLEALLMAIIRPLISELKDFAEPFVIPIAKDLVEKRIVMHEGVIDDFDKAIDVIEKTFQQPGIILRCDPLFHIDGLVEKLDRQWKHLGTADRNCFNLECPMMENALQMGKLCLMGSENLNELFRAHISAADRFYAKDVRWTVLNLQLELSAESMGFLHDGYQLWLDVTGDKNKLLHRQQLWRCGKLKKNLLKMDISLSAPLYVGDLTRCSLYVKRDSGNYPAEKLKGRLRLYDKDTGILLFVKENAVLANTSGSSVEILPPDRDSRTEQITRKMENARRVNTLSKLLVTVNTGTDGTDSSVKFHIIGRKGETLFTKSLDKSCYNDFEAGDVDSYTVTLDRTIPVDEVGCFGISKKDNGGSWKLSKIMVTCVGGGTADGVVIANQSFNNRKIGEDICSISVDWNAMRAPELKLVKEEITKLLVSVHTADVLWSGTDDDIYLEIYSSNALLKQVELNNAGNDFERNRLDTFCVSVADKQGRGIQSADLMAFRIVKKIPKGRIGDDWRIDELRIYNYDGGRTLAVFAPEYSDHNYHEFKKENNGLTLTALHT